MWFEQLVGFREEDPDQVRDNLVVTNGVLKSKINGRQFQHGLLETPSLAELRQRAGHLLKGSSAPCTVVSEVVADVQELHQASDCAAALFQVASQFNLLEMVSPEVTPEQGVDRYEHDRTQGPACAIACGAGTIYRNYFARVGDERTGQTADHQIDCLHDVGVALGNKKNDLWRMENGYALASAHGLRVIADRLDSMDDVALDDLRGKLRVGVQWDTEVTIGGNGQLVSQVYGSAMPVAYSSHGSAQWEPFARLVLEASYEATVLVALLNRERTGNADAFMTLLGGGVFGNEFAWICDAIRRAISVVRGAGLNLKIVSYGGSNPFVRDLVDAR